VGHGGKSEPDSLGIPHTSGSPPSQELKSLSPSKGSLHNSVSTNHLAAEDGVGNTVSTNHLPTEDGVGNTVSTNHLPAEDGVASTKHLPAEDGVGNAVSTNHLPAEDRVASTKHLPAEDRVGNAVSTNHLPAEDRVASTKHLPAEDWVGNAVSTNHLPAEDRVKTEEVSDGTVTRESGSTIENSKSSTNVGHKPTTSVSSLIQSQARFVKNSEGVSKLVGDGLQQHLEKQDQGIETEFGDRMAGQLHDSSMSKAAKKDKTPKVKQVNPEERKYKLNEIIHPRCIMMLGSFTRRALLNDLDKQLQKEGLMEQQAASPSQKNYETCVARNPKSLYNFRWSVIAPPVSIRSASPSYDKHQKEDGEQLVVGGEETATIEGDDLNSFLFIGPFTKEHKAKKDSFPLMLYDQEAFLRALEYSNPVNKEGRWLVYAVYPTPGKRQFPDVPTSEEKTYDGDPYISEDGFPYMGQKGSKNRFLILPAFYAVESGLRTALILTDGLPSKFINNFLAANEGRGGYKCDFRLVFAKITEEKGGNMDQTLDAREFTISAHLSGVVENEDEGSYPLDLYWDRHMPPRKESRPDIGTMIVSSQTRLGTWGDPKHETYFKEYKKKFALTPQMVAQGKLPGYVVVRYRRVYIMWSLESVTLPQHVKTNAKRLVDQFIVPISTTHAAGGEETFKKKTKPKRRSPSNSGNMEDPALSDDEENEEESGDEDQVSDSNSDNENPPRPQEASAPKEPIPTAKKTTRKKRGPTKPALKKTLDQLLVLNPKEQTLEIHVFCFELKTKQPEYDGFYKKVTDYLAEIESSETLQGKKYNRIKGKVKLNFYKPPTSYEGLNPANKEFIDSIVGIDWKAGLIMSSLQDTVKREVPHSIDQYSMGFKGVRDLHLSE